MMNKEGFLVFHQSILFLVVLVGVVAAQQLAAAPPIPIVRSEMEQDGAGNFKTR